jgi:ribonuclease-3
MVASTDPAPTGGGTSGEAAGGHRLADRIGYRFHDPSLLDEAMSHRSWCAEQGGLASNERLEFLGDAVLGLVVAEYTFRNYPELSDGQLSKVRASVVNTRVLGEVGLDLGVADHLRLGRGEDLSGGRAKESILADATEAVIGALYLDGGLAEAERLVLSLLRDRIAVAVGEPGVSDHKSRLQEESVRLGRGVPRYELVGFGPDHARRYRATVYVAGLRLGTGEGRSKKDAEQVAAQAACKSLEDERGGGDA